MKVKLVEVELVIDFVEDVSADPLARDADIKAESTLTEEEWP